MRRFVLIVVLALALLSPAAHAQAATSTSTTAGSNVADDPLPDDGADAGGGRPFLILGPVVVVVAVTLTVAVLRGRRPQPGD